MIAKKRKFSGHTPTWCPGCGDWAIGGAIKEALANQDLDPSTVGVVFGIGCSGNMNDFLNAYAYHALHGRAIPTAVGLKLANHSMPTLVIAGDGDAYGEGGNHFFHAAEEIMTSQSLCMIMVFTDLQPADAPTTHKAQSLSPHQPE